MNNETSSSAESTPAVRIEAKRARRVGTITMGSTLVLAGVAILLYIFYPDLNISLLLSLAPLVLIALGLEMIIMYIVRRGERLRYDFGFYTVEYTAYRIQHRQRIHVAVLE